MSDAEVEALKLAIAADRSWYHWAAMTLILGLFGEVAIALWFREGRSRLEIALAVGLAAVVAAAVTGEEYFGGRIEEGFDALDRHTELRVVAADAKAAEADARAAEANERAAEANARAAEAVLKTERARADAHRAALLARPRTLTNWLSPEDKMLMDPFAGTLLVIVTSTTADDETREFAWSLSIVDVAGWKCERLMRIGAMSGLKLWSAQVTAARPEPADALLRTHQAAKAFAALVERETGVEATDWPLEPGVAQAAFPELAARGIDVMAPNLIIAEVGKRSFSDDAHKDWWRRHVEERGGLALDE